MQSDRAAHRVIRLMPSSISCRSPSAFDSAGGKTLSMKGSPRPASELARLCRDEDWDNRRIMAGAMEVLQVEGIVPHLISMIARVIGCADFELENENDWSHDHDGIDPTSDSRDDELQQNEPAEPIQRLLKGGDLNEPGVTLRQFRVELGVLLNLAKDGRRTSPAESIDRI